MSRRLSPTAIDQHVADRLRAARINSGLTQQRAAELLGCTFQQLQKYERGKNRVTVGTLVLLARFYGKTANWFFQDAPGADDTADRPDTAVRLLMTVKGRQLADDFLSIADPASRELVAHVAAKLARRDAPLQQAAE